MRDTFLIFGRPVIGEEEIAEVVDSLRSGWVGTGPKVQRFETMLSEYVGIPFARCVSSCTAALILAMDVRRLEHFYPRNEIPAFVPVVTVVAAACAAPRARIAGLILAVALLSVFLIAALYVQTHPYLERPNWHALADALGRTRAPRVIVAADGTTAQPLKIYLPNVSWVQRHASACSSARSTSSGRRSSSRSCRGCGGSLSRDGGRGGGRSR